MKTLLKQLIRTSLSARGIAVAGLLVAGSVQTSQAGSADPSAGGSFTWDLLSSGSGQRGIALITFNSDRTFRGYQMFAAVPPVSSTNSSGDGRGGNDGRGGSGGSTGGTNHFFYGFSPVDGIWQISSKGQIVGFFTEALNVTSLATNFQASSVLETIVNNQTAETTNIIINFANGQATVITNFAWPNPAGYSQIYSFDNKNFTVGVGSAETTNVVSFIGKASSNKRLTLMCNTTFGKVTYTGIPAVPALNLTGNWIGSRKLNGLQSSEFFSLVSFSQDNPFPVIFPDLANFPNVFFTTNGVGAGYGYTGVAMFSQHKTVGFTFFKDDGSIRSTIGSLKATRIGPTANTLGLEEPLNRVNFTATLQ